MGCWERKSEGSHHQDFVGFCVEFRFHSCMMKNHGRVLRKFLIWFDFWFKRITLTATWGINSWRQLSTPMLYTFPFSSQPSGYSPGHREFLQMYSEHKFLSIIWPVSSTVKRFPLVALYTVFLTIKYLFKCSRSAWRGYESSNCWGMIPLLSVAPYSPPSQLSFSNPCCSLPTLHKFSSKYYLPFLSLSFLPPHIRSSSWAVNISF